MRSKGIFSTTRAEGEGEEILLHASVPQPTAKVKNVASRWDFLILDTWFWEIVSITFSAACFIAICSVLLGYDQKAMPNFPTGLTLNTIVSILATASKSALLCMVGTSIGQLKWIWFQGGKKRPVYDLQSFDDASRGPWGSVMVLLRYSRNGSFVLSLGAIITILSLAFDPFIQQVLRFPVRQVISSSSTAAIEQAVLAFKPTPGITPDLFFGAIETGLWSENFDLNPTCPSGNCTWPTFQSAGWCSKCENVTSAATLVGCDIGSFNTSNHEAQVVPCNITLSDGTWFDNAIEGAWQDTVYGEHFVLDFSNEQIAKVNNRTGPYLNQSILGVWSPLMAVSYIELSPPENSTAAKFKEKLEIIHLIECVLSPCVKTYNVSVSNGVPSIQTPSPEFGEIFYSGNDSIIPSPDPFNWSEAIEYREQQNKKCWKPKRGALINVTLTKDNWPPESTLWENAEFAGCPVPDDPSRDWVEGVTTTSMLYNNTDQLWRWCMKTAPDLALHRIDGHNFADVMSNIAASMTKYARDISEQTLQGIAYVPQVYVSVDWAFLILPGLLVLLGIIFLLLTISINSKHDLSLWKSSILPAIFHGLPGGMVPHEYSSASTMERMAQEATVKFEVSDTEKRLLLRK